MNEIAQLKSQVMQAVQKEYPNINLRILSKQATRVAQQLPNLTSDALSMFALCGVIALLIEEEK